MAGTDRGAVGPPEYFTAPDGTRLAYRTLGEGRPVLLVHGFFSSGTGTWLPVARRLAGQGYRVVLPDLRGHGRSETPIDPAAYPADVLVDDAVALLDHLGVDDLDAAGYSLGARTLLRTVLRGAPIRRVVLGGQGLTAMEQSAGRTADRLLRDAGWFRDQWARKTPDEQAALRALLASSVGTPLAQIRAISTTALVVMGDADDPAGGEALAAALPNARYAPLAGDHVQAAGNPDFTDLVADFLDEGAY